MHDVASLTSEIDALAREIRESPMGRRAEMQPVFGQALQRLADAGVQVPARLRNLHEQLLEEAMEAKFNNLPI